VTVLSDRDIRLSQRSHNLLEPFVSENVGPCSVDLTLGTEYIRGDEPWSMDEWDLLPGEFILATTVEKVNIPRNLVGQVSGKSSMMRMGVQVCNDAGFIDAGFRGLITLELANHGHKPVSLKSGMRICQITFTVLSSPAERPYGSASLDSHYQGQDTVKGSVLS